MSQKDEILTALQSMMKIAESDFEKSHTPNGENDLREHFFAGQVSAFRKMLKFVFGIQEKVDTIPSEELLSNMENPEYRKLWNYPRIAELFSDKAWQN